MVKEYDYIVIGGGSGGIASANRAAMHGAKVILFEGKEVGGTCVNVGCVPKKVMWYGAQVAETLHRYAGEYGFDVTINKFDFATLKANRQAYIDRIHGSYERGFDSNGVERVYEYARFVDHHTVSVIQHPISLLRQVVTPFIQIFQVVNMELPPMVSLS